MTALDFNAIATAIATISVSGVNVKDLSGIPTEAASRNVPMLYPKPNGWLGAISISRDSTNTDSGGRQTASYVLTYTYLHQAIGEGRGLFEKYPSFGTKIGAVIKAIAQAPALAGLADIFVENVGEMGPTTDPTGHVFHGCEIQIRVKEFLES